MVDNSLGKYWLERNPNSTIKDSLEYLLPGEIQVIDEKISPEDLKTESGPVLLTWHPSLILRRPDAAAAAEAEAQLTRDLSCAAAWLGDA